MAPRVGFEVAIQAGDIVQTCAIAVRIGKAGTVCKTVRTALATRVVLGARGVKVSAGAIMIVTLGATGDTAGLKRG